MIRPQDDEKGKDARKELKGRNSKGSHYFFLISNKKSSLLRRKNFSLLITLLFWGTLHKVRIKVNNSGKYDFFVELPGKL